MKSLEGSLPPNSLLLRLITYSYKSSFRQKWKEGTIWSYQSFSWIWMSWCCAHLRQGGEPGRTWDTWQSIRLKEGTAWVVPGGFETLLWLLLGTSEDLKEQITSPFWQNNSYLLNSFISALVHTFFFFFWMVAIWGNDRNTSKGKILFCSESYTMKLYRNYNT